MSLSGSCPGSASFHSVTNVTNDINAELDDDYVIPLMVLQNNDDCTVVQPSGYNIRDSHLRAFGEVAFNTPAETLAATQSCSPVNQNSYNCQHKFYTQDGNSQSRSIVETVFYTGPLATQNPSDTNQGHYWIGGADGNESKWAVKKGPSYRTLSGISLIAMLKMERYLTISHR